MTEYTKQTWVDGTTPIDAEHMNHIESGIETNSNEISTIAYQVGSHTHTEYIRNDTLVGTGSISVNRKAETTIGQNSVAVGYETTASGDVSHAEGNGTTASGSSAHAEGYGTTASGGNSHAEGYGTTASEMASHAEGGSTKASGDYSHAEGDGTTASGYASHAEGSGTTASGKRSHAEGNGTTASGDYSHVQGRNNIVDTENIYAHIVGNGTLTTYVPGTGIVYGVPSNAHTLDWNGNAWFAGTVEGTAIILKSSTEGSTKRFKITVDDSGTLSATEITE